MISFYPGPSRVYDEIPQWTKEAHKKGVLSMNHRSKAFEELSRKTISLLRHKLKIPKDYTIFFVSSATECWEIIAQSLVVKKSIHLHNGAFGEKWFDYTLRLRPEAQSVPFSPEKQLDPASLIFNDGEVICITQNETSNGTQVSNEIISSIQKNHPAHLIAVDATSSMAGIFLDFSAAHVWFASVQKCFGLPAGLALLICSADAMKKMEHIGEKNHYNSLLFMREMMSRWQTPFTPNVLGIYLLKCAMQRTDKIKAVDKKISRRQQSWVQFFKNSKNLKMLISNERVLSKTVITVTGNPRLIEMVHLIARKRGFLPGEGYGGLKKNTFRIANFPAIKRKEIQKLMAFLLPYL